jgi:hypothetical protein
MKYGFYFLLGGVLVSLSTYFSAKGKGFLAAFVSTFPAITGSTIILIYLNGGNEAAHAYAKHLLWIVPAWLTYVGVFIVGINHVGFWPTWFTAMTLYMVAIAIIRTTMP